VLSRVRAAGNLGTSPEGRGARAVLAANGELMTVDITSAVDAERTRAEVRRADVAPPPGAPADDRGSLGTLSWPRAAKVAGLAAAVAALTALSIAAGHVVGPPAQAHPTSVMSRQPPPAP
jgi:hypothetical protein